MSLQASSPHEAVASVSSEMISKLKAVSIILLFGPSGSGKTSFANVASGSSMKVGNGVKSSTQQVEFSDIFLIDNNPVIVVDCPGFDDTYLSETEILQCLVGFLTTAHSSKLEIVGLIYMHRIIDPRVGGSSFRHMSMFKAMCGAESLKNAVYVTNMWSEPPTENEVRREAELKDSEEFFGGPLAEGAQMARHVGTRESAHDIVRLVLDKDPTVTKLQHQLVDEGMKLEDTDAGRLLGEDLEDALSQHQQNMEELNAQQERALELNNQEWVKRLEAETKKAEERGRQLAQQLKSLKGSKHPKPAAQKPIECVPNCHNTVIDAADMMAGFQKMMEDSKRRDGQRRAEARAAEQRRQEQLEFRANTHVTAAYDIPRQPQSTFSLFSLPRVIHSFLSPNLPHSTTSASAGAQGPRYPQHYERLSSSNSLFEGATHTRASRAPLDDLHFRAGWRGSTEDERMRRPSRGREDTGDMRGDRFEDRSGRRRSATTEGTSRSLGKDGSRTTLDGHYLRGDRHGTTEPETRMRVSRSRGEIEDRRGEHSEDVYGRRHSAAKEGTSRSMGNDERRRGLKIEQGVVRRPGDVGSSSTFR